jgi:very-short-patch-repair endonuclease
MAAIIASEVKLRPLRDAVMDASTWQERLVAIRAMYQEYARLGVHPSEVDPYSLGLHDMMTPIEWDLWKDIRQTNRCKFVPQYPVGRFTLDFADIDNRLAIEADGKAYHDPARDKARDQELFDKHGWRVFRVTGAETRRVLPSPTEFIANRSELVGTPPSYNEIDEASAAYFMTTSAGVVRAIRDVFIDCAVADDNNWQIRTLNAHRLASFPVRG